MNGGRHILATLVTDDRVGSLRTGVHSTLPICRPTVFNPSFPEAVTELDDRSSALAERSMGFGRTPFGIFS
jgi:hypothetical protein